MIVIYQNLEFYHKLRKDTWACSDIILCLLLGISLALLTFGVFIDYKIDIKVIPIYFMILFFEFVWLLSIYWRMFNDATLISSVIIVLVSAETILFLKRDYKELAWLSTPFLFFSLIQFALSDNLFNCNIDHTDLLKYHEVNI